MFNSITVSNLSNWNWNTSFISPFKGKTFQALSIMMCKHITFYRDILNTLKNSYLLVSKASKSWPRLHMSQYQMPQQHGMRKTNFDPTFFLVIFLSINILFLDQPSKNTF